MIYKLNYCWELANGRVRWEYKGIIKNIDEEIKKYEAIKEKPKSGWAGVRIKEKESNKIVYEKIF